MDIKKNSILSLFFVLIITIIISIPGFSEDTRILIENEGSFGWAQTMTITVTVSEELQMLKPNSLEIGFINIDSNQNDYIELSSVNGNKPYDNYYQGETMSERIFTSIQYIGNNDDEIYYAYHLPYNGEEKLVFTLNSKDFVVDYIENAMYIGFYTIEEISQEVYNENSMTKQSNEQYYAGDIFFHAIEHEVIGTSVQIAPVELSYQLPTGYEKMEVTITNDDNPYRDYINIDLKTTKDNRLYPLQAYLNQEVDYTTYNFKHKVCRPNDSIYNSEKEEYLKMIATTDFPGKNDSNYTKEYLIPIEENLLEKFQAVDGYRTISKRIISRENEDYYFTESNEYLKVDYKTNSMSYDESLIFIMPNGLIHTFSYNKHEEFPDAYFTSDDEYKNAALEFEHFINTFDFVPKNNGMMPKEYGEFMRGPDSLSIYLVSNKVSVLNTGIYNTATKSDSDFNPGIKINKPYDYNEPLLLYGEIISNDENPPITFFEDTYTSTCIKKVDSDFIAFHMITKGIKSEKPYNPIQKVRFSLRNENNELMAKPVTLTVKLADPSPKVTLVEGPNTATQSGSENSFTIKVTDPDNKEVSLRVTSVFGNVRPSSGNFSKKFEVTVNTDETITIGFQAPEIGNFNLNKEMENFSMLALQEGTFNTLAADLEGMYLGKFADKLKSKYSFNNNIYRSTRDWNNYNDKMEAITSIKSAKDAYDKWEKINNAYTNFGNTMNVLNAGIGGEQMGKDIYEATKIENKGIFEASADAGIAGISVLQTGVGLFGSAVSYIPGGNIISSKATLWFNLSTNIWKNNLKYLSKTEKIDRANEVTELIPVIVVATDAAGFSTRFVIIVPVIGMEVN